MDKELHILIVEDLPSDVELAQRELRSVIENFAVRVVDTEEDFIIALEEFSPDLIISDYQMPSFDGLSALQIAQERSPLTPFIMLTGSMNEDTAVRCMKAGADDYVIKEHIKRLGSAVISAIEKKKIESEKKKSEKELQKLNLAINNSREVIFMTDKEGSFTFTNSEFTKLYGYTDEEIIGKASPRILKSDFYAKEDYENFWATLKSGQNIPSAQYVNRGKNGKLIDVEGSADPIIDNDGNVIGFLGIQRDITKRKQAESKLKSALVKAEESDRLKSAFLATMSHELRTPLNAIIGFSSLIDEDLPVEEIIDFGKLIHSSGNHLLSIIDELFDITLIEAGETKMNYELVALEPILDNIHKIIQAVQQKAEKTSIDLNLIIPPEQKDLVIKTDSLKLKQILLNLLKNALKFTDKGHINYGFSIEREDGKSILKFYVEDTGIGIPREKQGFIFDMFRQADDTSTRKHDGVGIGLSISKKLTELLSGKLWVVSDEGEGSTFYFTLPFEEGADFKHIENAVPVKYEKSDKLKEKTILAVEDDEVSLELLKVILDKSGFNIIGAANGKEAIEICKENANIDLVLMDINMPVMDGYEATKALKKLKPNLPIIAQTAYAIAGDREKIIEAGCDDYISKPIKKKDLLEIVRKYQG